MATPASLPEEAAALFREPPETFIAARNALAARLADAGDAEGSRAVKALRKPTVAAWALDQVAERDPDGVRALLDAGAELRAAQQAALSSKRGATDRLQEAGATRKEAVARLARVAEDALSDGGRSAGAHTDAIVQALEICSVDPEAGAALAAGVLERPPERAAGFGELFGLTSVEGGLDQASGRPRQRSAGSGRAGRADRKAEAARLRRDRDALARRARKARESAEGFTRELEGMRRRLEVVEGKHAKAEADASELELELARAERALRRADERRDDDG
jgi:hypothetical protein